VYAVLVAQEQIFYDVRRWWFGLGLACRCGGYLDRCGRSFVGEAMTELHGKEFVARACTVSRMHFFLGGPFVVLSKFVYPRTLAFSTFWIHVAPYNGQSCVSSKMQTDLFIFLLLLSQNVGSNHVLALDSLHDVTVSEYPPV
jgi:hypothetical protein